MALAIVATMAAGIAAPLPAPMTRHEADGAMSDGSATAVLLAAGAPSPARDAAVAAGLPIFEMKTAGEKGYQFIGAPIGAPAAASRPRPDDVALVLSSSGTTGQPKRIPRTHRNIAATSADVTRVMRATARDRCFNLAPMAFSQGLNALLNMLWAGGSVVALPGFDLARLPERIGAFRPTWFSVTPTVLRAIDSDEAASAAVRAHPPRLIRASAGAITASEVLALEDRFDAPVLHSYGMSEASFISGEAFGAARRKPGSAGTVNHEVRVLGEDGLPVPDGEMGEIVTRGANVFPGYLDDPGANSAVFLPDGWFRTGDVGRIDADGFLFVTGRVKEMIKRGGVAIAPLEIEGALLADPAVAEACVFGVPHLELGEDVAAAVVLRPGALATERRLRNHVAALLSPAKMPRQIVFVTEIAKTATGKPLRAELAAAVASVLEPVSAAREPAAEGEAADDLTAGIAAIWAGILGCGAVAGSDDLFELGADSLQAARMHVALEQAYGIELPTGLLFEERTPARVAAWLAGRLAATAPAEFSESAKRPIFFVTSATSGKNPLRPARLGEIIDPERAVHDLAVPARLMTSVGDDPDEAARTARTCIDTVRATQPRGPYLLAGIGDGCAMAHEMARQWERAGEAVHLLLIDNRSHSANAEAHQAPQVDAPFGGSVTLAADRESLADGVAQGWEAIFGDRLRIVPMARHERPRRALLEVAGAVRGWLETVEGPSGERPE
jgi:acyl-CoA synthetase (AMP-forming)/AMP-acid ligase II/acyl carrier protein